MHAPKFHALNILRLPQLFLVIKQEKKKHSFRPMYPIAYWKSLLFLLLTLFVKCLNLFVVWTSRMYRKISSSRTRYSSVNMICICLARFVTFADIKNYTYCLVWTLIPNLRLFSGILSQRPQFMTFRHKTYDYLAAEG